MLTWLLVLTLLTRIPPMLSLPLIQDESVYAMMIEEQYRHPTLIPTFLGVPVSWKPFLFFWTYAPAATWPAVTEAVYRLPSLLFALGSVAASYLLLRNARLSVNTAGLSMLIFIFCFFTIYPQSTLLTDSLAFFLISSSLYLYSQEPLGRGRYALGALLAAAAVFTKLSLGFMVPLLAAAYFYSFGRRTLKDPAFLLSLLAAPLAYGAHILLLDSAGLAGEITFQSGGHVVSGAGLMGQLEILSGSFITIMMTGSIIWLSLAIYGFAMNWKENFFLSAWFSLTIIPFFTASMLPWYYLPVMPAVGYFAALTLIRWKGREKIDAAFWAFLGFLLLVVIAVLLYNYSTYFAHYSDHREAGKMMAGKEGVLFIGRYVPGVVAYKVLEDYKSGNPLDYGWIAFPQEGTDYSGLAPFIEDYHYSGVTVIDRTFSELFSRKEIFRKETNLTSFRYIVVTEVGGGSLPYDVIYNKSNVTIYEVD